MRRFRSRSFTANILASILLVGMGLVGCLMLLMIVEPNEPRAFFGTLGLFGLIALIPLGALRKPNQARGGIIPRIRLGLPTFGQGWLSRRRQRALEGRPLKPWKRRKSSFVPQPWGQPETSTFEPIKGDGETGARAP